MTAQPEPHPQGPVPVFPSNYPLTEDEEEWLEKAEKCHDNYDQWEAIVTVQIFTSIPDLLLIEVQKLKMAKEVFLKMFWGIERWLPGHNWQVR